MSFRQFRPSAPLAVSYLFGCGGKAAAGAVGVRILCVVDTHVHADHVCAGRRLAEAYGVDDGDILRLGNVTAQAPPTPEPIRFLMTDKARAEEPWFLATGHTLVIGDDEAFVVQRLKDIPPPRAANAGVVFA